MNEDESVNRKRAPKNVVRSDIQMRGVSPVATNESKKLSKYIYVRVRDLDRLDISFHLALLLSLLASIDIRRNKRLITKIPTKAGEESFREQCFLGDM